MFVFFQTFTPNIQVHIYKVSPNPLNYHDIIILGFPTFECLLLSDITPDNNELFNFDFEESRKKYLSERPIGEKELLIIK